MADKKNDNVDKSEEVNLPNPTVDRESDHVLTPEQSAEGANPDLGEDLAREAVEKFNAEGGEVKQVKGPDGQRNFIQTPLEDKSDNGKVYSDVRVNPRDTNAPDAGLAPDGRRVAS